MPSKTIGQRKTKMWFFLHKLLGIFSITLDKHSFLILVLKRKENYFWIGEFFF